MRGSYFETVNEIEFRQNLTRSRLQWWIEKNEKPDWFAWFGFYPAQESVRAAKDQLKAMDDYGLVVSELESCEIFGA